jgi:hypothetical protein
MLKHKTESEPHPLLISLAYRGVSVIAVVWTFALHPSGTDVSLQTLVPEWTLPQLTIENLPLDLSSALRLFWRNHLSLP